MGAFTIKYQNHPGSGITAQGGLKFYEDEQTIERKLHPLPSYVPLSDLLGEAVFWFQFPETLAIWIFPLLLFAYGFPIAILVTSAIYIAAAVFYLLRYSRPLNFLHLVLGGTLVPLIAYIAWAVAFIITGSAWAIISLIFGFVLFKLVSTLVFEFPLQLLLLRIQILPTPLVSDHVLYNVASYHAARLGIRGQKSQSND